MSDPTEAIQQRSASKNTFIASVVVVAVIVVIAAVSILTGGSVNNNTLPTSNLVGKHLKDFSLAGLSSGQEAAPWEAHHPSVIIFFASWCPPCKKEIPQLATFLRQHKEKGIFVLGMDAGDQRPAAKVFVKKDRVAFPIAFDTNSDVTSGVFSIGQLPDTVFVNGHGVVTGVHLGTITTQELRAGIAQLRSA